MPSVLDIESGRRAFGGLCGTSLYIARASDRLAARAEVDLVLDTLSCGLLGEAAG
jgi:hypothetical protein